MHYYNNIFFMYTLSFILILLNNIQLKCLQFMIVSKAGNITKITKSVNVTNSDINLKMGFVPISRNVRSHDMFQNRLNFKKGLKLSIAV